jgi:hypothetical protein
MDDLYRRESARNRHRDDEPEDELPRKKSRERERDSDEDPDERPRRRSRVQDDPEDDREERRPRKKRPGGFKRTAEGHSIDKWLPLLAIVFVAVFVVIGLVFWWFTYNPLARTVDQYVFEPQGMNANAPVGKMVVVNLKDRTIDGLYWMLPATVQASRHDQVKTVAQVRYHHNHVGRYTNGQPAIQIDAEVRVLDMQSKALIATSRFQGSPPPQSMMVRRGRSGNGSGDPPNDQVVNWLQSLGRK